MKFLFLRDCEASVYLGSSVSHGILPAEAAEPRQSFFGVPQAAMPYSRSEVPGNYAECAQGQPGMSSIPFGLNDKSHLVQEHSKEHVNADSHQSVQQGAKKNFSSQGHPSGKPGSRLLKQALGQAISRHERPVQNRDDKNEPRQHFQPAPTNPFENWKPAIVDNNSWPSNVTPDSRNQKDLSNADVSAAGHGKWHVQYAGSVSMMNDDVKSGREFGTPIEGRNGAAKHNLLRFSAPKVGRRAPSTKGKSSLMKILICISPLVLGDCQNHQSIQHPASLHTGIACISC